MLAQDFDVLPAIDVLEGRVVRLHQGRREAVTIEGGDPVELARRFRDEGARRLHLVDLDGAFNGTPTLGLVERVASAGGLPLQVGGGYRTESAIADAIAAGADRVMVGTAALSPTFLRAAAARFGDQLVVAIDVRDGEVAVDGWTRSSGTTAATLAARLRRSRGQTAARHEHGARRIARGARRRAPRRGARSPDCR